jgi:capping protein alpha
VTADRALEDKRAQLQTAFDLYITNHFAACEASAAVYAKEGKLVVQISGERPNLRNYWSGRWHSEWTVAPSGTSAAVTGEIKVRAVCCVHGA